MTIQLRFPMKALFVLLLLSYVFGSQRAFAQARETLRLTIVDPSGALINGAQVGLSKNGNKIAPQTPSAGVYVFEQVPVGQYELEVQAQGFAKHDEAQFQIEQRGVKELTIRLSIEAERQQIAVSGRASGLSTEAGENANATVLNGRDLDALSDDPTELQDELHALAGPAAGPNGGEIYVDGFTGGQLPPRRSIREIRVNSNPFSAEFDKIGYGRIEIFTNPSTGPLHGHFLISGNDSGWNTASPLTQEQPSYYSYFMQGTLSVPISKISSFLLNGLDVRRANQTVVDAVNPADTAQSYSVLFPNPSNFLYLNPRVDMKLGSGQTLSIEDSFYDSTSQGRGVGALALPQQAFNSDYKENAFEFHDASALNIHFANEVQFRWRRIRNSQTPQSTLPTILVQGAFTTGGNAAGSLQDHQDIAELQDYATAGTGKHMLRFGLRGRLFHDTNFSNGGSNGLYVFNSVADYLAATPAKYTLTQASQPTVRTVVFDGSAFVQDEWSVRPHLDLGMGIRLEGQNHISQPVNIAPRLDASWAPGARGRTANIVLHAGYGWFYNRFIAPSSLNQSAATPYLIQVLHYNGLNQQSIVLNSPSFFNPDATVPISSFPPGSATIPYQYTIAPNFKASLEMQAALGIDQKVGKGTTISATYLNTRGIHQYFTNSVGAPDFDPTSYTVLGPTPTQYNYQYQSEGIYHQDQLIVTVNSQLKRLSLHAVYTFNNAKSDTQGVAYFPSVSTKPRFDYGRAGFAVENQLLTTATYPAPHGFLIGAYLAAQSGTPFNISVGEDLTKNNQFNARPTYGTCGAPGVVSTRYGCLDTAPLGKSEPIVPYNLGTGPANFIFNLRLSKSISFPEQYRSSMTHAPGGATKRPRYSLTLTANASNLFNIANFGAPNGTLLSPLFGKSQTLATGQFSTSSPGNRSISLQAFFNF